MSDIAPHITAFFRERLEKERAVSPHTRATYALVFNSCSSSPAASLMSGPRLCNWNSWMPGSCSGFWKISRQRVVTEHELAMHA